MKINKDIKLSNFFAIILFGALAAFPLMGQDFYNEMVSRILILAIFAIGLDLLVGYTGLVSFGHAAWFGLGAYSFAVLSASYQITNSLWITLAFAILGSALISFMVGLLALRTKGIYFLMVTLAFAQVFYFIVHDVPEIGGSTDGINLYARPLTGISGFDLEDNLVMYYFVFGSLLLSIFLFWMILRSPFGRAIQGIKENEHRMSSIGFNIFGYKLASFVIASMFGSFAGYLFSVLSYGANPELFSWHKSAEVLLMLTLGGIGKFWGGLIGAFAFVVLKEIFMTYTDWWQLWLGLTIIFVVLFLPGGLLSISTRIKLLVGKKYA